MVETTLALDNYRKACDSGRGAVFLSVARGKVRPEKLKNIISNQAACMWLPRMRPLWHSVPCKP